MEPQDHWDRRRFLALAGGTTILAGCAAEPLEEDEEADNGDDDVETDDEEDDGDNGEEPDGESESDGQEETDEDTDNETEEADDEETEDEEESSDGEEGTGDDESDDESEGEDADTEKGEADSEEDNDTTDEGNDGEEPGEEAEGDEQEDADEEADDEAEETDDQETGDDPAEEEEPEDEEPEEDEVSEETETPTPEETEEPTEEETEAAAETETETQTEEETTTEETSEEEASTEEPTEETPEETEEPTEEEPEIVDHQLESEQGLAKVVGTVANNTDEEFAVRVEAWFFGSDGEQLAHSGDLTSSLRSGDRWDFEIPTFIDREEVDDYEIDIAALGEPGEIEEIHQEPPGEEEEIEDDEDTPSEPPLSDITIQVVGPAGEPIEGASVTGEGEPHEADIPLTFDGETGPDGIHENQIYENDYVIEVDHPDYEATTVEHTHDGESELRVELEKVVDTSALTIRVTDSEGEPIEGASVVGQGEPHEANIPLEFSGETDSNGEYSDVIYENDYVIEVDHPDYSATTVEHSHSGESEVVVELGTAEDDNGDEPSEGDDEDPSEDDDDDTEDPPEEGDNNRESDEPEIVTHELLEDESGHAKVEGVVANNSNTELSLVEVEAWFYNVDDQQIDSHLDTTTRLLPGEEWGFEILTFIDREEVADYDIGLDYVEEP